MRPFFCHRDIFTGGTYDFDYHIGEAGVDEVVAVGVVADEILQSRRVCLEGHDNRKGRIVGFTVRSVDFLSDEI